MSEAASGIGGIGVVVGRVRCGGFVVSAVAVIVVTVVVVTARSLLGLLIGSSSSKCQVELVGGVGISSLKTRFLIRPRCVFFPYWFLR